MQTRSMVRGWIAGVAWVLFLLAPPPSAPTSAASAAVLAAPGAAVAAPARQSQRSRRDTVRTTDVVDLGNEREIRLDHPLTAVESDEFAVIEGLEDGGVLRFFSAPALRFRTAVPVRFGGHVVPVGNVAPDFDGIYSLWIRRAGDGWELVFNDQGDVWGSQHDPAADRLVVPLEHELVDGAGEAFAGDLTWDAGAETGVLAFAWGPHRWSAAFSVAPGDARSDDEVDG